jgi:hypothetical protein
MKKQLLSYFILSLIFVFSNDLSAQYQVNGNASSNGSGCYQITPDITAQVGSIWNTNLISLNDPFDFTFNVFLGCKDDGADGICFGLQPVSVSVEMEWALEE